MSNSRSGKTVRLTVAQAVITYLSKQYSVADGERRRLIPATLGIFGHGNVAGMGQALDQLSDLMPFVQGRNEQSLVHLATGYAKAMNRVAPPSPSPRRSVRAR
jgi:3D-(3,5/4)-trihydroxycyclohexane-1,2-dione acylhydrolase (decyclizing)